jgi:membrane protease YdiL (CAAX protease family)
LLERTNQTASRSQTWAGCCAASIAVTLVVLHDAASRFPGWLTPRWFLEFTEPLLALAGLAAVLCIHDGDTSLLGLRSAPIQGWRHWIRIALWFGAAIALLLFVCSSIWILSGWPIPLPPRPTNLVMKLFWMCFYAPLVEEIVFRSLLTAAVYPLIGQRGAIVVSGVVFAMIHVIGGNPGPDNQVAGFLLEWAFLRSGTILVPMAMHAAGNLIAFGIHIASWYWLSALA